MVTKTDHVSSQTNVIFVQSTLIATYSINYINVYTLRIKLRTKRRTDNVSEQLWANRSVTRKT